MSLQALDLIANILNVIGFALLLSNEPLKKFVAYKRKRIDAYGRPTDYKPYWKSRLDVWRSPFGLLFLLVGNLILLYLSWKGL